MPLVGLVDGVPTVSGLLTVGEWDALNAGPRVVYERPGDNAISGKVTQLQYGPVDPTDPDLIKAMRLLGLVWTDD